MEQSAITRAADCFVAARRTGKPIDAFPDECSPANAADVNAIVDAVTARLTDRVERDDRRLEDRTSCTSRGSRR